jgi:mannose-1-phosphate guanylyltransferase
MARQFISTGEFFWNAGIFVWRLSTLRKAYNTYLPNIAKSIFALTADTPATEVERVYSLCDTISVDFGIMEHAENVYVLEGSFPWSDVETWDLLYNTYPHDENGNSIISGTVFPYEVHNTVVHIPSRKTIVVQGLDGYIIAENNDTLLICKMSEEQRIKQFSGQDK